ncbi:Protein-disulfide reductase [Rhodopseudomonas palustris BisB5]|uniref:Protein-disulfide reductase n=1 Tax=Rhodopseudomonas palustris (strain BisB5) TaxID=316057 RepID=Q130M8_RHOPS|nr:Protein-disulfide reductase [Rhodopseudomonas palustris BisB5]
MADRIVRIVILLVAIAAGAEAAYAAKAAPFQLSAQPGANGVDLTWRIASGDYLYRDKIVVTTADGARVAVQTPTGELKDDPNFGMTEIYHRSVTATIPADAVKSASRLMVTYQGCAERGICYPPMTASVDLGTYQVSAASGETPSAGQARTSDLPIIPQLAEPAAEPATVAASVLPSMTQGWLPLLLAFAGFGLLLALTPCVLPMIPIVAGMLTRSGPGISPARGFALAAIYTLAMASAYAALGVAAAWSGQNLQGALQAPLALAVMASIYVALALSSFGLFELQFPAGFGGNLAGRLNGRAGPLLGAAALGFTSALIVGPCVTPPLAAALLYVAQTGDAPRGASALFALGLGMGFPLILVGLFGAGVLPRSGPWLVTIRKLFGFVFLGLAVALISRVLPGVVTLLLWAGIAFGLAAFLGAFDQLDRLGGALRRSGKAAGLAVFVYGATLIVGAAGGSDDPLRPLAVFGADPTPATAIVARTVTSMPALDQAISDARARGKPIMIDFTAEWCTSCKTMDRNVFGDPAVRQRLKDVALIRADVTKTNADTAALMKRFDVVGPPTVVFLDQRDGSEIPSARTIGEVSADAFFQTLQRVGSSS